MRTAIPLFGILLATAVLLGRPAGGQSGALDPPLVLAQFPKTALEAFSGGTLRSDYGEGGRIVTVVPGREPRVLTASFHGAADPDVSFDGTRILFAGRKEVADPWCVWEMRADGTEARRVTCGPGGARQPLYLPTMYTLTPTDTEAWDQIAFVGVLPGETNEAGVGPHTALFACGRDGGRERRLTFNLSSDLDPVVLPDGRMVFASWQRRSLDRGPHGRLALFGVNIDGTDLMLFAGDEGRRVKHMPAYAGDRRVVFVEADAVEGDGSGGLGEVSLRRNLHSYRSLAGSGDGLYHSPSAHPDGGVLVSWRPADGSGTHGIYHLDPATGRRTLVFDDPETHDVQARALAPSPLPDRRSSPLRDDDPEGELYGLDVGLSDLAASVWPRKIARRLRVLEGRPVPAAEAGLAPFRPPQRLLGEVDLAADGSFHVRVPANVPIQLQLLDEDGLALRSCGWIWVRNREERGCIGCHEDPERTPPNRFVKALETPAAALNLPPQRRRTVLFERDVQPIVERRCASCHGEGGPPPRLGGGGRVGDDDRRRLEEYVVPGRARASPLVWHLLGRPTARPWDGVAGPVSAKPMPPEEGALSPEERRAFIEWIDFGAAGAASPPERTAVGGGGGGPR